LSSEKGVGSEEEVEDEWSVITFSTDVDNAAADDDDAAAAGTREGPTGVLEWHRRMGRGENARERRRDEDAMDFMLGGRTVLFRE
jgi:hypothetical protein